MSAQEHHDVAIVGGGVAGLYAAWRILTEARSRGGRLPAVKIYEQSDRTGGRLQTWLPLGRGGGLRAELGGMRFLDSQRLLANLLPTLGFGGEYPLFPVTGPNLRLLLRGRGTPLDTGQPTARYRVPDRLRDMTPDVVMNDVIMDVLGTYENQQVLKKLIGRDRPENRQEWDTVKAELTWRDRRLWDIGFWNLISEIRDPDTLQHLYDGETYQYLCDAFGYYGLARNWNSAEAMQTALLDFTATSQYLTLADGMQALPDRLTEELARLGCSIELGTRLTGFDIGPDGRPLLSLTGQTGTRTDTADRLILDLPRRSLELLDPTRAFDLRDDGPVGELVRTVTPHPAFKLFLWYSDRWWERWGITHGRSVCDLPIRQTYYFAPADPSAHPAGLLMASYDDARAVEYWHGLLPRRDELPTSRSELHTAMRRFAQQVVPTDDGHEVPIPPPHLHAATEGMRRQARAQLALLHGVPEDDVPPAEVGAFADWTLDPYGGGWNFWNPGVDVRAAMERMKQPLGPDIPVHVVGEAYSGLQGWVEGALTATEVTMQRHLGLGRPGWLPADYYLGW